MSELAALITAGTGAVTVLGGGIAWLWRRVEKGFADVKIELAKCQARERKATDREAKHLIVIELLWQEVERRSRGAPNAVLGRGRKILDDLKEQADD